MSRLSKVLPYLVVAALAFASRPSDPVEAGPAEGPERRPDQTYLTFPEWYLVFSPEEYARFLEKPRPPSEFPFMGHVGQLWDSYATVTEETERFPFNSDYHTMIVVIGTSTTVEYGVHSAYETLVGRVSELAAPSDDEGDFVGTDEDLYAALVARDYVDFINVTPFYEFDFRGALAGLWDLPLTGPGMLRKLERRYALTTEFAIKALYADFIAWGTASGFTPPVHSTRVRVDRLPPVDGIRIERIRDLAGAGESGVEAFLPRYQAFTDASRELALRGANFQEIAGNGADAIVLVSVIVDEHFVLPPGVDVLFEQPLLSAPPLRRLVLQSPIGEFGATLRTVAPRVERVEHVFDF